MGRERELTSVLSLLTRHQTVEVVGEHGIGKTALLMRLIKLEGRSQDVFWVAGGDVHSDALPAIDPPTSRPTLLVIDEAELFEVDDIKKLIRNASWAKVLIGSTRPMGVGVQFALPPLNRSEFVAAARLILGPRVDEDALELLYKESHGSLRVMHSLLSGPDFRSADELANLIRPFKSKGLVDTEGRPLSSKSPTARKLLVEVRAINDEFLRRAADDPDFLFQISPRQFEELVAELFSRKGFQVDLTPRTRDGGKDIYVARHDSIGRMLFIVECKRYAPNRPVGVGVIRELHGVADLERVTGSIAVTTSYFTHQARAHAEQLQYRMSLKDYFDVRRWLDESRPA